MPRSAQCRRYRGGARNAVQGLVWNLWVSRVEFGWVPDAVDQAVKQLLRDIERGQRR
jgi:hypothetical protein